MNPILHHKQTIIAKARANAVRSVNFERVLMYWQIGKRLVVEEQSGKEGAEYGAEIIKKLSLALEPEYGSGFSARQLERFRQFYRGYPNASALRTQFSWSHSQLLRRRNPKHGFCIFNLNAFG
ncbi:DUF1016 family protein [bacterium]|nr:DUF1016 family protein [bacterium]